MKPRTDVIQIPSLGSFDSPAHYYAALFHEMGHVIGATARLDRKMTGSFTSEDYSREELVAE